MTKLEFAEDCLRTLQNLLPGLTQVDETSALQPNRIEGGEQKIRMLRLRGDEGVAAIGAGDSASERTRANTERRLTSESMEDGDDENENEDFSSAFVSM